MQGHRIMLPFHIPGTLSANITITFTAPFDGRFMHISAVASNDSDATMILGKSGDSDFTLASCVIGDSGTPVTKTVANWATTNPNGAFNKDDVLIFTLDYDGSGGTAAQNVTVVLTLLEG